MRRAQQQSPLGKQHVREKADVRAASAGQRLRRSLLSTDEGGLFSRQTDRESAAQLTPCFPELGDLIRSAMRYSEDRETLDSPASSAQRLRSPSARRLRASGRGDIAQQFAWFAPYEGVCLSPNWGSLRAFPERS